VIETFLESMDGQSAYIEEVIHQAETSLRHLEKLKGLVHSVHAQVTAADRTLEVKQHELLSTLWSRLGGNIRNKRVFKNNFELLKDLYVYHDMARTHVEAALYALRTMDNGIKELQTSVRKPGLNSNSSIPVEVHVRSITAGLERLRAGKMAAKRNRRDYRAVVEQLSIGR
jgi:hypothetical protein